MPQQVPRSIGTGYRRFLGWFMALLLLAGLLFSATLLTLRWAGFPQFLKSRVEARLRAHGLSAQLGPVWLRGTRVVMDGVTLAPLDPATGTVLTLDRVELELSRPALRRGRLRLDAATVDRGRLTWTLTSPHAPPRQISVDQLRGHLRLLPSDALQLTRLEGRLFGAAVHLSGSISHASALRHWPLRARPDRPKIDLQTRLHHWLQELESLELAPDSLVHVQVQGDGRDPDSLRVELSVETPKAAWPQGNIDRLQINGTVTPSGPAPGRAQLQWTLEWDRAEIRGLRWGGLKATGLMSGSLSNLTLSGSAWQARLTSFENHSLTGRNLALSVGTLPSPGQTGRFQTTLTFNAGTFHSPWSSSASNLLTADTLHGLTRSEPWEAHWRLGAGPATSPWGTAAQARLSGRVGPKARVVSSDAVDGHWGFWAKLKPFDLDWAGEIWEFKGRDLELEGASLAGRWRAPELLVRRLGATLYGGQIQSSARLDVATREARAQAELDFDVHQLEPWLTPESRRWLRQFGWQSPPQVLGEARVTLPIWTNTQPRWREEVLPTLELAGHFTGANGTFRNIPVRSARAHFTLTNRVWRLPDLHVEQPEGEALLDYAGDMSTHAYRWRVQGRMDPRAIKPLLEEEGPKRVLDQLEFSEPPTFQGEVSGVWNQPETIALDGWIGATNFIFRGESCNRLTSRLSLTNSVLYFSDVTIRHADEAITVPAGSLDLLNRVVYVTNAISTMDPDRVTRVIGPKIRAAIRPYRFETPPTVRVNGRLPTVNVRDADVRFEVAGEEFSYWKLRLSSVTGEVLWRGDDLSISDVQAGFYGGELAWRGDFDFSPPKGALFHYSGTFRKADLHLLMLDLGTGTNHVAGSLDGHLTIDSAASTDLGSWNGRGHVRLRDGFLWDIPIFGFFSPVLNTIIPGLGNSPVSAGDATFTLNQSVVSTRDLQLISPALRLQYNGRVAFDGKVDARMQAEILRDAWAVGPVVSFALSPLSKAFEYQISGTVQQPRSEPVYIPRVLLWPFHPIRSLRRFLGRSDREPPQTPFGPRRSP